MRAYKGGSGSPSAAHLLPAAVLLASVCKSERNAAQSIDHPSTSAALFELEQILSFFLGTFHAAAVAASVPSFPPLSLLLLICPFPFLLLLCVLTSLWRRARRNWALIPKCDI